MAQLPDDKHLSHTLEMMLRRKVKATVIKPVPTADLIVAGHYIDGQQRAQCALLADLPMTVRAGAALSRIPADAADDLIKEGTPDENVQENFAEVLNMCSRVFDPGSQLRLTLSVTEFGAAALSATTKALLAPGRKRRDFDVEIESYGHGRVTVVLAA